MADWRNNENYMRNFLMWMALRHFDRYPEETVVCVGGAAPDRVGQVLLAVYLVVSDIAIRVEIRLPCHNRRAVNHLDFSRKATRRVSRDSPRDISALTINPGAPKGKDRVLMRWP